MLRASETLSIRMKSSFETIACTWRARTQETRATKATFHIYDVTTPANPVLLKGFLSGASTHTAMPTDDGKTLIVAEERANGNVKIYDISNINSPNDPDAPVLKASLNAANVCHLGTCISAHSPHHVHVHGNLMFLPWYEAGLLVFNISNPASPVLVGASTPHPARQTNYNGNWGVDLSMGSKASAAERSIREFARRRCVGCRHPGRL